MKAEKDSPKKGKKGDDPNVSGTKDPSKEAESSPKKKKKKDKEEDSPEKKKEAKEAKKSKKPDKPDKPDKKPDKKEDKKEDDAEDYTLVDSPPVQYQPVSSKKVPTFLVTREIGKRYLARERYLKVCLVEMLIYIVFLLVLGTLAAFQHIHSEYYLSRVMTKLFVERRFKIVDTGGYETISFNEINTLDQLWEYIYYFVKWTDWQYWYSEGTKVAAVDENLKHMQFFNNRLVGRARIRQLRVLGNKCSIPDAEMKKLFERCYPEYGPSTKSKINIGVSYKKTGLKGPNGTLNNPKTIPNAWKHIEASKLGSASISGEISKYDGGGYIVDVLPEMREVAEDPSNPSGSTESKEQVADDLKKKKTIKNLLAQWRWIDRATRALVLQFTTYNANENIFFTLQLLFELPPTGGVLPSHRIYVEKFLIRDFSDHLVFILFIVFCLFVLGYTLSEVFEIAYFKTQYFDHFWNFFDLLILILCYIAIGLYVYSMSVINGKNGIGKLITNLKLKEKDEGEQLYTSFDRLNNAKENFITFLAVVFFFAAVKLLKYMNFNHAMFQMQTTLSKATKDIACFSIMFFIVFITFAQLGHLLFGSQVRDFRSFIHSIFALLRTAVGDFDYHKIENVNHFLGPVFFFAYIFFIYFILVNMFLAIIIDTYSEVRTSLRDQGKELQMCDIVGGYLGKVCGCFKKKKPAAASPERKMSRVYVDIQSLLRMCGFTEMEIDLFFAKFDIPKDKHISRDQMRQKLLTNFNIKPQEKGKASAVAPEKDDIGEKLMNRIQVLENNIADVNSKIDLIDSKIDAIQQIRARRTHVEDEKK